MFNFEIGQKVTVGNAKEAEAFSCMPVYGETFVVDNINTSGSTLYKGHYVHPLACWLEGDASGPTTFQRVAEMNTAFGNPQGNPAKIDAEKVRKQVLNIFDEYVELLTALGAKAAILNKFKTAHGAVADSFSGKIDTDAFRDALADIKVFADGASHLAGFDGDADMHVVVDAVMTRFVKDDADKEATQALHAAKGVTDVYFEGEYPTMVMKSASDQPDAPTGKFLKSASYSQPVFLKA